MLKVGNAMNESATNLQPKDFEMTTTDWGRIAMTIKSLNKSKSVKVLIGNNVLVVGNLPSQTCRLDIRNDKFRVETPGEGFQEVNGLSTAVEMMKPFIY
jgi:hypothetical protein